MAIAPRRKSATRANTLKAARKTYMVAHKSAYARYWATHAAALKEHGDGHPQFAAKVKAAQGELVAALHGARAARTSPASGAKVGR